MNRHPADSPLQIFRALAPVLLALIIVSVGRWAIRERYQIVADVLVVVLAFAVIVLVWTLIYPLALERPLFALRGQLARWRRALTERRNFNRWTEKWHEYTSFVLGHLSRRNVQAWRDAQHEYRALRTWLMENGSLLQPEAVVHVRDHLIRQWGPLNLTEYENRFGGDAGFFPLYRHLDCDQQLLEMERREHHITHTFAGVWDGLSSYSVRRGWGSLQPMDVSHPPTPRSYQAGLPRV